MKVLFSAVGGTDPISNCKDGSMLHICRVYQPDKVYLYLSKEMCAYHDQDDRYQKSLQLLGEDLHWHCEIKVIQDKEMEHVQIFDAFIAPFEQMLSEIRQKDKPKEILVNVSSGTPAMKSSLQMLSMLWNDITAIQVSTPRKSLNKYHEDKDQYHLDIQWECNEDRKEGFENRCMVSDAKRLLDRIRIENIQKYIAEYDYEAAKMMAGTLSVKPSQEFVDCLDIAIARNRLDLYYVNNNRKKYDLQHWFLFTGEREMQEYEYLLAMRIKLLKKQYADFIRDVTPIFYSFSEKVLEKSCGLKFADIGKEQKSGAWNLSLKKLRMQNIKPQNNWRDYTFISSYVILSILQQKSSDKKVLDLMGKIRIVEQKVRNLAAHQILGVTAGWIKKQTGFEPIQIMDMMFELAGYAGLKICCKDKQVYQVMNQDLMGML